MGIGKLGVVLAVAGAMFSAQAALFVHVIAKPVAHAEKGMLASPARTPSRDDLPTFGEEIVVTAPYRMKRATADARVAPWAKPDPVTLAVNGYCLVER